MLKEKKSGQIWSKVVKFKQKKCDQSYSVDG